ncbi:MAG: methylmalonyl-CoA mutase [Sulfobacillus benefaciens]|uniref:methylmalonyl-CoA mutase n=1 Tax=Sulfobacillus benefaciens TaxID=453960 RepID=A0A2T2XFK6_9FIRM|nr:MAG: methylmalonyl-CoA mutase [Sulfobacillus benefaciens]
MGDPKEELLAAYRQWDKAVLKPFVRKSPSQEPSFETVSEMPVDPLYTPLDWDSSAYLDKLGFPGVAPYTRGIYPTMYRGRLWTMRQYAGFGTAEESNRRYRYLLEQGQTGLSVAFDLPTQMGYDSDDPAADGEVGKVGVAIDSLADMEILLDGIPLDRVSVSMTINAPAAILLLMVAAVAEKQHVPLEKLSGTIQNDILKEYAARGTYIFPPKPSMRLITDTFQWCAKNLPSWNTISISGYHIREAGSTAAQEIAFTLANGVAYVEAAIAAGLAVDSFAPRLSFFFNAHMDFFEEVAKFRAARRLWADIMQRRFKAKDPRSWQLRFHTQTAGSTLTAQQPDNNVVRVTLQALSAVLGGTQSLHTNSKDEALALPTEMSARLALRTQQVIAYESGVTTTVDPLGGSYYVENLTDRLEALAKTYLQHIDELGGAVEAIEQGYVQREIQDAAWRFQQKIEHGQRVIVGVNRFVTDDEDHRDLLRVDAALQRRQIAKLAHIRQQRDPAAVDTALAWLDRAAVGGENLLDPLLAAVKAYATLGEMVRVLKRHFGQYRPPAVL